MTEEEARAIYREGEESVVRYLMQAANLIEGLGCSPSPASSPEQDDGQSRGITVGDVQSLMPPSNRSREKQVLWNKYVASGINPLEATRLAGYKDRQSTYDNLKSPVLIALNKADLLRNNITDDSVFKALYKLLHAKLIVTEYIIEPMQVNEETGVAKKWIKRKITHELDDTRAIAEGIKIWLRLQGRDASVLQSSESRTSNLQVNVNTNGEGDTSVSLALIDPEMLSLTGSDLSQALRERRELRQQTMLPDTTRKK